MLGVCWGEMLSNLTVFMRRYLMVFLVSLAVLAQIVIVMDSLILPLRARIRTVDDLPALERGAYLGFGDEFAGFTAFLRENSPEAASIVIPPMSSDPVYGNTALMQYFLYPRSITNCNGGQRFEACFEQFAGEASFIISTSDYHAEEQSGLDARWIPYEGDKGIYTFWR